MTPKPRSSKKEETAIVQSPQLPLPLKYEPIPADAVPQVLRRLFDLALENNTAAAKLLLDVLKVKSEEAPAALTAEDALKLIQDFIRDTA